MARKKSFADIYEQFQRIVQGTQRQMNGMSPSKKRYTQLRSRIARAEDAMGNYTQNIINKAKSDGVTPNAKRKYSQRVYMGMSNG